MAAARFLVGIDFSPDSRRALEEARRLARRAHASLTLAHVRPSSDVRAAVVEERGDLVRAGGRVLRTELSEHYERRLSAWARKSAGEKTLLLRGAPDIALARESRRGYALLVLGRRGRNVISSLFVGSTAERVLSRARVPVLVVPGR